MGVDFFHPRASRRTFLKAAAAAGAALGLPMLPVTRAVAAAVDEMGSYKWCACVINCGQRCPVRCFTRGGQVIRIETDNSQPDGNVPRQIRACQRGRSMRQRIYSPDRLRYPMKRVGERGEGKFQRISWDEAVKTIASEWKRIRAKYGNEAIYWQYCSGQQSLVSSRRAWQRLMNLMGGFLKYYGSYSNAQLSAAFPLTYGGRPASLPSEIAHAELYVLFGNNPLVNRPSGGGKGYQIDLARERHRPRMILIDPAFTDTATSRADQWIPIRPGTDAALVSALAYEFITHGWIDQAFLDKYCVGFDAKTLPKSAPAHSDYRSYIMGEGPDKTPKTPEWAAPITGIPVDVIKNLAREMGTTKPLFVSQGWGPQRQANGEETARAIAMVPILLGQVGLPGTNSGEHEGNTPFPAVYLPVGTNPVKATIPVYLWTDAILRGHEMTRRTDALHGAERLKSDVKMIINSGGNTMINQHGDANWTDRVLRDTSKLEFLVVCDNMMTPSARYADILLPDTLGPETNDLASNGGSHGDVAGLLAIQKAVEPQFEQLPSWEICRRIARELGLEEKYTEGLTQMDWVRWCYEETRKKVKQLPDFETFWKNGRALVWGYRKDPIALEKFRQDPVKNKLKTPSGKIEIYSERLAKEVKDWVLPKGDAISPIPVFMQTWDMPGDPKAKKYPLQCFGFHGHGRIHSTFHNLPWLRELHPDAVFMNTLDAQKRGIKDGDKVRIFNDRGIVELPARVTPRLMPGVCTIPQGAWYKPVMKDGRRVDVGGCINTLTGHRPSPYAKGNAQHNILVEIRRI
ncbi:molybdopterin-dependent oxidoreductase [Mesosutterella sp. AGMB02718]|uniref:Molybdopterin-dependent oxidoreductase n=1 Tax=Mesosutterella faecium TaxID=2925194 RepID=A0ABT7IPU7_9BURK|nr:DMSO/selenate family reductase complex A subunit [Mesosutterella sp. AGMB02718]MDL2059911.1 molybdopterin-dependent oxidoreductase [Mesosutterella sp. AGMB02718]